MAEIGPGLARSAFQEAAAAATEEAAAEQLGFVPDTADEAPAATETAPPVVVETPVAEETSPTETLLAGKYKNAEELERGYEELKAFADRQGNDVGEQRALLQAYAERLAVVESQASQPVKQQITAELIENDPAGATQLAYEQQDPTAVGTAYRQWMAEDPGAASTWYAERRSEEQASALRAEFSERERKLEERFAPIQAQNEQAALREAVQSLPDEVRTFLADAPTVQALATQFPVIGRAIVTGTPEERLNAISALHSIHRGRTADTLGQAVTDVARTTAQEAQAARDDAFVASSTASQEETSTWEQQEQQRMREYALHKSTPFGGGLVIPSKS